MRLSTTVDADLLENARRVSGKRDAALVDEALAALLAKHRSVEVAASYAAARGEVWWCEAAEIGRRPVVVLSRDAAIPRHRRTPVAPCTTNLRGLPSEVVLEPGDDPVPLRSAVNLDSIESVSVAILVERLGRLAESRMGEICSALAIAVDCSD